MNRRDFETLSLTLESTPVLLARAAAAFPPGCERVRPAAGGFSFLENVWHLADLEREAYGERIRRLIEEDNPSLPNFDGDRMARERAYQERELDRGLAAFARARARNLETLRKMGRREWKRSGNQEGVGRIALADLPRMMADHDRSHAADIANLIAAIRGGTELDRPCPSSAVA